MSPATRGAALQENETVVSTEGACEVGQKKVDDHSRWVQVDQYPRYLKTRQLLPEAHLHATPLDPAVALDLHPLLLRFSTVPSHSRQYL